MFIKDHLKITYAYFKECIVGNQNQKHDIYRLGERILACLAMLLEAIDFIGWIPDTFVVREKINC